MSVRLYVWRVPGRRVPALVWRLDRDRRRLRRTPGVVFAKLLGTGQDHRFGPSSVDPTRWALLVVSSTTTTASTSAKGGCRLDLRPLASRGRWSGVAPFETTDPNTEDPSTENPGPDAEHTGMVLALTRARLRPSRAVAFWRALGPPTRAAAGAPGLLAAFGIGEAPIGWPGTVSLWRSAQDLVEFAYRRPEHRQVVARTPAQRWYAEELFARFAVLDITGDVGVIGWTGNSPAERRAA